MGYFPSTYVTQLASGEKPLQVIQAVQVPSVSPPHLHEPPVKLLRDQIVIQVANSGGSVSVGGSVIIRTADWKQAACPAEFLAQI